MSVAWDCSLLTGRFTHLRNDVRQVRAAKHVVEGREIAVQRVGQLSLRRLQTIPEILLDRELLVGRLEIVALKAVREIAEFLNQFGTKSHAVLTVAGRAQLDELTFNRDQLLIQFVGCLLQLACPESGS